MGKAIPSARMGVAGVDHLPVQRGSSGTEPSSDAPVAATKIKLDRLANRRGRVGSRLGYGTMMLAGAARPGRKFSLL
jgi:hypothetical protein